MSLDVDDIYFDRGQAIIAVCPYCCLTDYVSVCVRYNSRSVFCSVLFLTSAAVSFFLRTCLFLQEITYKRKPKPSPGKKKDNLQLPQTPVKKTLNTFPDTKTRQIFYDRLPSPSTRRRSRHPVYLTFKVSRQDGEVLHIYRSRAGSMCR